MLSSESYALLAISNLNRAASFRQAVSEVLPFEVVLVRDGEDALHEMARRGLPALLLIDLSLPRVDGFAVVRKIRRQPSDTETRVLVVAAHESLRAAAAELTGQLGISSILSLDIEPAALKDAVAAQFPAIRATPLTVTAGTSEPTTTLAEGSALDADDVMDRAAIEVKRRFRMPMSVGYLRVGGEEHMTFHLAAREPDQAMAVGDVSEFRFLRQVADSSEPLVIPSVQSHPVFAKFMLNGSKSVRGFAAVPVPTSREGMRAALCVIDTKAVALNATDIDVLAAFARHIGQELDRVSTQPEPKLTVVDTNSEDVKALQHLAATDPLTGLANRRGGEKHIANEISRAKREKRPLSCILIDIDRFKQVNDTFGHQAGDQLLRDISALLRRTVRAYDIIVRWGGEEFLLVLPGVDLDLARVLADRVRAAVESLDTHGIGPITISAGAARFENDFDFATTLRTADRRLYEAKASGRNRVV